MLADLALTAGLVFVLNLIPAFGPPTWAALIFLRLHFGIAAVPLIIVGAISSAAGRTVLALTARRFSGHLSAERRASLEVARAAIEGRKSGTATMLGLFLLSPLPSAQLFLAAGVTGVRLRPLVGVFFAGRLVSYSIYVGGAAAAERQLGGVLTRGLTSPIGIALQLVMLAALVALLRVDWGRVLEQRSRKRQDP